MPVTGQVATPGQTMVAGGELVPGFFALGVRSVRSVLKVIDYKDLGSLNRFVDAYGKIRAARKTGTCAKHQRRLAVAIKRARHLALLPFATSRMHRAR